MTSLSFILQVFLHQLFSDSLAIDNLMHAFYLLVLGTHEYLWTCGPALNLQDNWFFRLTCEHFIIFNFQARSLTSNLTEEKAAAVQQSHIPRQELVRHLHFSICSFWVIHLASVLAFNCQLTLEKFISFKQPFLLSITCARDLFPTM